MCDIAPAYGNSLLITLNIYGYKLSLFSQKNQSNVLLCNSSGKPQYLSTVLYLNILILEKFQMESQGDDTNR